MDGGMETHGLNNRAVGIVAWNLRSIGWSDEGVQCACGGVYIRAAFGLAVTVVKFICSIGTPRRGRAAAVGRHRLPAAWGVGLETWRNN
jgi:hypothetical protein